MREYYDWFRIYQSFQRFKEIYPPYFSKLIKHYTAAEMTEGMKRSREAG
jgi:hypothetical protein